MKSYSQRLANIAGQIEGVKKMIEAGDDCAKVLTQMKAIKSAINSVMHKYMAEKIESCIQSGKVEDFSSIKKLIVKTSQ